MMFKEISKSEKGVTLIEILMVMGLFAILVSFVTMNLLRPQVSSAVQFNAATILSDINQQQIKAMVGDSEGSGSAQPHGIYFGTTSYTLFRGSSYSSGAAGNFEVALADGATITNVTLPSSQVVFSRRTGQVVGYVSGSDTVTIEHSGVNKVITINRFGVADVQ